MPGNTSLGKVRYQFRVLAGNIIDLAPILFHVEELRLGTIIFAEKFPFAIPNGQVRQVFVSIKGIAIGWTTEINRRLA